jgi:hypothetical protein
LIYRRAARLRHRSFSPDGFSFCSRRNFSTAMDASCGAE